ncbi:MAG: sel1 repeat family protein [Candidatus Accumulibacter sp.]|nr:sel1 repeat family protein [Accumulibacter sp.]
MTARNDVSKPKVGRLRKYRFVLIGALLVAGASYLLTMGGGKFSPFSDHSGGKSNAGKQSIEAVAKYSPTDIAAGAERGDAVFQAALGDVYRYGRDGYEKDIRKALLWYKKSAEQGNSNAMRKLALAHAEGEGAGDDALALGWLEKAALAGDAQAPNYLCTWYFIGSHTPQNYPKSAQWCKVAAQQGEEGAQHMLAQMYFDGNGVSRNNILAYAWANIAAKNGSKNSANLRDMAQRHLNRGELVYAQGLAANWRVGEQIVDLGFKPQ